MGFDAGRFRTSSGLAVADADPDDAEHLSARAFLGRSKERFALVPLEVARHMSAADRLLTLLLFLGRARPHKGENGWFPLSLDCCGLVGLDERQRRRAIESLHHKGLIEVRSRKGKSPEVRLKLKGG